LLKYLAPTVVILSVSVAGVVGMKSIFLAVVLLPRTLNALLAALLVKKAITNLFVVMDTATALANPTLPLAQNISNTSALLELQPPMLFTQLVPKAVLRANICLKLVPLILIPSAPLVLFAEIMSLSFPSANKPLIPFVKPAALVQQMPLFYPAVPTTILFAELALPDTSPLATHSLMMLMKPRTVLFTKKLTGLWDLAVVLTDRLTTLVPLNQPAMWLTVPILLKSTPVAT